MSIASGRVSWQSFTVDPATRAEFSRGEILEKLSEFAFKDTDATEGELDTRGFVVFRRPAERDFSAASEDTFVGPYALFTFRRDRLRIQQAYFKEQVRVEQEATLKRTGLVRLDRARLAAIKLKVGEMLLSRALPSMHTADVAWSLDTNLIRIFSGSSAMVEGAVECLESALGFRLLQRLPFTRLLDIGMTADELDQATFPEPAYLPARIRP